MNKCKLNIIMNNNIEEFKSAVATFTNEHVCRKVDMSYCAGMHIAYILYLPKRGE